VTAKGKGELAEQIIALAKECGIPMHEDPDLITLLGELDLGDEIPPPLYRAVAEVIAFAYMLTGKVPEGFKAGD
jgi:flagellar biosynthesis protein